jgi:tripartite ATP-independent transporter DctP family solute receptor
MIRVTTTALALLLLPLLASCDRPAASGPETWRFAIEESEGSVQHAYALRFKQLVEQRTGGEVEVVVYPYGTLGTSTQVTEQLNMGVVELAMASPGSLGKFIPEMQVFLLHFVLSKDPRVNQQIFNDPELLASFDDLYQGKGLKLLSIYSEGQMVWTTKQEVRNPEDFAGVKMRVMTTPILLAAYEAYGASATPMPYSEVYSGLQLNMIDAQVNPIFAIERQKFHEVTNWLIFPGHTSYVTTCAANREFYDELPAEHRQVVDEVIEELDEYIFDLQTRLQTERLKLIIAGKKKQGKTLNIAGDLTPFLDSLSDEERAELVDDNEYLKLHPPLTIDERDMFEQASTDVQQVYLRIGGERAEEVLAAMREAVEERGIKSEISNPK